jgi:hypothetical protein
MAGAKRGALSRTLHDLPANANGTNGVVAGLDVLAVDGVRDHHEV